MYIYYIYIYPDCCIPLCNNFLQDTLFQISLTDIEKGFYCWYFLWNVLWWYCVRSMLLFKI